MMVAEPFAQPLQPCGQRGLVGRWFVAIIAWTRHVKYMRSNAFDAKQRIQQDRGRATAPEAARTILSGSNQVKNCQSSIKPLKSNLNRPIAESPTIAP
jgi:hypothetical protein